MHQEGYNGSSIIRWGGLMGTRSWGLDETETGLKGTTDNLYIPLGPARS